MDESEKQFSVTSAASSTSGRARKPFPISSERTGIIELLIPSVCPTVLRMGAALALVAAITGTGRAQSFSEALDTASLVWTSSGSTLTTNGLWRGHSSLDAHDGLDCALSQLEAECAYISQSASLETMVQGPARVTFWWKISGSIAYSYSWLSCGADSGSQRSIAADMNPDWAMEEVFVDSGIHAVAWTHETYWYASPPWCAYGTSVARVDEVSVTPLTVPVIVEQPFDLTSDAGTTASFQVTAYGAAPMNYHWRLDGTNLVGATNNIYTITNVQAQHAGTYSVVVSNGYGFSVSADALLTVRAIPTITQQPQDRTVNAGEPTTFSVAAEGGAPLVYQWRFYGTNLAGATAPSYTITNVQPEHSGPYSVIVSNAYDFAVSSNATLAVRTIPVITSQPQGQTVTEGSSASFYIWASGSAPLRYQWCFNGTNLDGATNASFIISNAQTNQTGIYSAVVSNSYGAATSSNALLSVLYVPPSPTLGIALDAPLLAWKTSGSGGIWEAQTANTHDGVDAAQSTLDSPYASAWLATTVTGPGTLTFYWKVDNQYYPYPVMLISQGLLGVSVDGQLRDTLGYTTAGFWVQAQYAIAPGQHTVRWSFYRADFTPPYAYLRSFVGVDQVVFTPDAPTPPPAIAVNDGRLGVSSNGFGFSLSGSAGQVVIVEGSANLVNWYPLQTNILGSNSLYFGDLDWTYYSARFYRVRSR
jgi:hypothetical protein